VQGPGDWAARQQALFSSAPDRGESRTILIASDSPQLTLGPIVEAFALLEQHDIVLGPVEDGGYYLVGAKTVLPELFVGVPMGTDAVLEVTMRRAVRRRLRVGTVPTLRDLDQLEDLQAALAAGELDASPRTRLVVADLLAADSR